jgi:hypothetical protein
MDWINVAQGRNKWASLVNMVINLWDSYIVANFRTSRGLIILAPQE